MREGFTNMPSLMQNKRSPDPTFDPAHSTLAKSVRSTSTLRTMPAYLARLTRPELMRIAPRVRET